MSIAIHWFRRDLRLHDNAAFYHALKSGFQVLPIFIFDKNILDDLKEGNHLQEDKRLLFIYNKIIELKYQLNNLGSEIRIYYGHPEEVWKEIISEFDVSHVFTNHDYEPYAIDRDEQVKTLLMEKGIGFSSYKDQCIFERNEVIKDDGKPYTVFTPYSRKWKAKLNDFYLKSYPCNKYYKFLINSNLVNKSVPSLESMGFANLSIDFPPIHVPDAILKQYKENRDTPGINGTSKLGVHLRFGTISIRELARTAFENGYETFLNELIWRDFYMMILSHFPHVVTGAFRPEYDIIPWNNNEEDFEKWCQGKTGYPIVDAGIRELVNTGFMHNRVRMIVASFLTKHLLIDWRKGEAFFAKYLLDFELASNNGGWQWAAGSGCDAAPYFRVFNPHLQTQKFDSKGIYIKKWVPEINSFEYPKEIIEHSIARQRALDTYSKALAK